MKESKGLPKLEKVSDVNFASSGLFLESPDQ